MRPRPSRSARGANARREGDPAPECLAGELAESHRQLQRQAQKLAEALSRTRETAQVHRADAVPSLTRLDCCSDLVRRWKAPIFWKTGRQPGLSHVRDGGGPRLRDRAGRVPLTGLRGRCAAGGAELSSRHPATEVRRVSAHRPDHPVRTGCRSAGAMARNGSTGHRRRNLWPDRRESPGNPGGSGHRSGSRDAEKPLLTSRYGMLPPTCLVMKGFPVQVRRRALGNPRKRAHSQRDPTDPGKSASPTSHATAGVVYTLAGSPQSSASCFTGSRHSAGMARPERFSAHCQTLRSRVDEPLGRV